MALLVLDDSRCILHFPKRFFKDQNESFCTEYMNWHFAICLPNVQFQMSNSRTVTASSTRRTSTTCWPPSARTRPMNIWWVDGSGYLISSNRSCPLSLSIQKVFSRLVSSHERRLPQSRMKPSPWILSKRTISFRLPILNPSRGWSVDFFPRVPSRWFQEICLIFYCYMESRRT